MDNKLNMQANPSSRHLSTSLYGFSYGMAAEQEEKGPVWTVPVRKQSQKYLTDMHTDSFHKPCYFLSWNFPCIICYARETKCYE